MDRPRYMLSALGTHFCRPEGLLGGFRGGCARVPAYGDPSLSPRARAHVAGPAPEALGSTKVGPKGWKHGIPLF